MPFQRTAVLCVCGALLLTTMACKQSGTERSNSVHVVLVGASIGQSWQISGWPRRTSAPGFTAESVAAWQFDKSDALSEVLMRPRRKVHLTRTFARSLLQPPPRRANIIILKECSSYFPADEVSYLGAVRDWVHDIRAHNIEPVVATVVPVTATRAIRDVGKQPSIREFNRLLRAFAERESIPLLDLEAALRREEPEGFLRDEFTNGDGSHLNAGAYTVLDAALHDLLCSLERKACSM